MTLRLCTFLLAVTLSAAPLSAQNTASTESIVATVAAKSANALALIRVRLHDEMMTGNVEGLGFCVAADGEKALLITLALDPRINSQTISAIDVVVPGFDGTLKGKFRSADPVSGIAFIDVEGPFKWNAIQFEPTADLSAGKLVASAALLDANLGYEPFYGVGYVSSILQIPGRTAFVTGGSLTNVGSPVFNQQGRAIGIVQQQLPMIQQIVSGDQPRNIAVRSMHESRYFVPVEEFIEVLQDPPAPGKRLPWIGVLEYAPAPKDLLDALNLKQPAVMAVKIDPEGPAARAGLEPKDIIIALNGKP
ncbi:MAG: serine protease, partial [Planctomycetes bacterium]|nr:serine protease [Planctomycetota bacterium]